MSSAPSSADPLYAALSRATAAILTGVRGAGASNPVVLVDGRSGAGKTSLVARVVAAWPTDTRVQVVALDRLYPGWDGLAAGARIAFEDILVPHARGLIGVWRRWDWELSEPAEASAVDPALPLIVEGCGVLTARSSRLADVTVWVDAPAQVRRHRAIERDGDTYRPHWQRWAAQEEAHIATDAPASLADITVMLP